jgi:hypothetical protein
MSLLLLALLQGAAPTVGDTVRIERVLGDMGGAVVRPQPWALGELGEQLGPAEVVQGARGAVVRYALVLWYPGEQTITMPGPVLVRRDGSSDTLAATSYRVRVLSVLPAGEPRSTLAPKPATAAVPIVSVSVLPLAILGGVAALGLAVVAFLWRRRGRAPLRPAKLEAFPPPDRLARWAAAGEYRAALEGWSWRLARRLAQSRDLDEMAAVQQVLEAITDQFYVPGEPERLAQLCERAAALDAAA